MRPSIILTGFWPPTNEMLRPFSEKNPNGWAGENWKQLGFDIFAYFPEFPENTLPAGVGVMRVDYNSVKSDLSTLYQKHRPLAFLSFGKGKDAPWELEVNYPDHWKTGLPKGIAKLPFLAIQEKINSSGQFPPDFVTVDDKGDAGTYVCGFTGLHLSELARKQHSLSIFGFIHVNTELTSASQALRLTLESVIEELKKI